MNNAEPVSQEPMMTAEEVARFLRISLSMVYKLRREGALPGVAVGALWRFHPEHVRALACHQWRGTTIAKRHSDSACVVAATSPAAGTPPAELRDPPSQGAPRPGEVAVPSRIGREGAVRRRGQAGTAPRSVSGTTLASLPSRMRSNAAATSSAAAARCSTI
jgi:excisionase family DNA binding protein